MTIRRLVLADAVAARPRLRLARGQAALCAPKSCSGGGTSPELLFGASLRPRMTVRASLCAAAALLAAVPAHGSDHDEQVWTSLLATTAVSDRVDVAVEIAPRFTDGPSRLGQFLVRPSITLKLPRDVTATLGYVYARTRFRGTAPNGEHRAWYQLGYVFHAEPGGVRLTGRTRVEQRYREGAADDVAWRLRQQVRFQSPLRSGGRVSAIVFNETFVGLNDTRWGVRTGVDQVRNFVGVGVPLSKQVSVESGYLNQAVFRVGPDRVNHIAVVNLIARL